VHPFLGLFCLTKSPAARSVVRPRKRRVRRCHVAVRAGGSDHGSDERVTYGGPWDTASVCGTGPRIGVYLTAGSHVGGTGTPWRIARRSNTAENIRGTQDIRILEFSTFAVKCNVLISGCKLRVKRPERCICNFSPSDPGNLSPNFQVTLLQNRFSWFSIVLENNLRSLNYQKLSRYGTGPALPCQHRVPTLLDLHGSGEWPHSYYYYGLVGTNINEFYSTSSNCTNDAPQ
jgi:hypothetical protein